VSRSDQLKPAERDAFLSRLIDHWEHRYTVWQRTDGVSERCTDPANPIDAADFTRPGRPPGYVEPVGKPTGALFELAGRSNVLMNAMH
jgi:hypothetical protein